MCEYDSDRHACEWGLQAQYTDTREKGESAVLRRTANGATYRTCDGIAVLEVVLKRHNLPQVPHQLEVAHLKPVTPIRHHDLRADASCSEWGQGQKRETVQVQWGQRMGAEGISGLSLRCGQTHDTTRHLQ
jgi:hypothetical protein